MSNNEFSTPKLTPMDGVKFPSVSPTEDSGYILSQEFKEYATLEVNERIDAIAGGIIPKGDILSTDLPTASEENMGWMYYLTDLGYKVISDGTQWVQFSDNMVTQTITDGDTAHAPSSDAVYDALQERVAAEEDLQSQIVNLNTSVETLDAIVGCEAEIENVDPSEGQSILSSSRLIHHVNLLPSGEFGLVGARDIKFNQLVQNGNFADNTLWVARLGSLSVSDNVATVTATSTSTEIGIYGDTDNKHDIYNGHKYLICVDFKHSSTCTLKLSYAGGNQQSVSYTTPNAWQRMCAIWTSTSDAHPATYALVGESVTSGSVMQFRNFISRDLTAIFGSGNEPTSVANVPAWMLSYTPHDEGSIVNLNPTAFYVRGINLNNEDYEEGVINAQGQPTPSSSYFRSKTFFEISPNTRYFYKCDANHNDTVFFYDINKNFISYTPSSIINTYFDSPANAQYAKLTRASGYGTEIQICYDSLPSAVKTVYHPYNGQTVPVSISGHYVNENCYDYVTNKVVDGVLRGEVHTRVGVVDLGDITFGYDSSVSLYYKDNAIPLAKKSATSRTVANLLSAKYMTVADYDVASSTEAVSIGTTGQLCVKSASTPTGILLYELAEEVVTYGEPLRSFSLTDYATVEPITPQTLPNRIDVPFSILSKSNNGIIEQIAQNTADIADHSAILSQHEARISNLEQIAGDYVTSDMQDHSIVPTGKASFALVETMKGVSRVENQLALAFNDTNWQFNDATGSFSDGVATFTATATRGNVAMKSSAGTRTLPSVAGRVVLISVDVKTTTATTSVRLYAYGGYAVKSCVSSTNWQTISHVVTTDASWGYDLTSNNRAMVEDNRSGSWDAVQVKDWVVTDLTLYFNNGTIPTLAEIQSKYPELLEPRSYNAGEIVDATYTKVESVGSNRMSLNGLEAFTSANVTFTPTFNSDGELEYLTATGTSNASGNLDILRYDDWHLPMGTYFVGFGANNLLADILVNVNGTWVTLERNGGTITVTDPSQAIWIRGRFGSGVAFGGAKFYPKANLGSTELTFSPYFTDTLPIPSVTLKGAGSVSDTLDVESGEITRNVKRVNLGDYNWTKNSYYGYFYCSLGDNFTDDSDYKVHALVSLPLDYVWVADSAMPDKSYRVINTVRIKDSAYESLTADQFKTAMDGVYLNYELATPTTESVTPTLNNTIKTEGGGSVYTDADVDGRFTLGFLNL